MVYIVVGSWDYEGSDVIAVYATREGAEARQAEEIAQKGYDWVTIQEHNPL